jgi:hypothetical protein
MSVESLERAESIAILYKFVLHRRYSPAKGVAFSANDGLLNSGVGIVAPPSHEYPWPLQAVCGSAYE